MVQLNSLSKKEQGKSLIDSYPKILLKRIANPFLKAASSVKVTYRLKRENQYHAIAKRPIIFLANHSCFQDTPIVCKTVKKHSYILTGVQKLEPLDEFFFHTNGAIFVDRKKKEDMALSKEAMEEYLKRNQSLIVFPEGTWNLSDALLVLELKWGIVEVAKKANAQIIPISLDYDTEHKICHTKFGSPILVEDYATKQEAIAAIRDTMATLRWEQIEAYPTLTRDEKTLEKLRRRKTEVCEEYPLFDYDYEQSVVFHSYDSPEKVFEPIKKLTITKQNAFLFSKQNKGIW